MCYYCYTNKLQFKESNLSECIKIEHTLEVIVGDTTSTTVKGRLLENLGSEVLNILQYDVTKEIRITGMEVNLLAKQRISKEEIFVEYY